MGDPDRRQAGMAEAERRAKRIRTAGRALARPLAHRLSVRDARRRLRLSGRTWAGVHHAGLPPRLPARPRSRRPRTRPAGRHSMPTWRGDTGLARGPPTPRSSLRCEPRPTPLTRSACSASPRSPSRASCSGGTIASRTRPRSCVARRPTLDCAYTNASSTFRRNKTGSIAGYRNSSGSIALWCSRSRSASTSPRAIIVRTSSRSWSNPRSILASAWE